MIGAETRYVPFGKYNRVGVVVDEPQTPGAHLAPLLIARLIAAVSSEIPSPTAP